MATTDDTQYAQTSLLGQERSVAVDNTWMAYWLVVLRMVGGWWLLHAGMGKLMNWPFDAAWFVGGAAQGTSLGPFVTLFSEGALLTFVNVAIPVGQTMIGLGLILGALTRTAAFFGALLMVFFYFINGEGGAWAHGVVTGELLGLLIFAMIATIGAGRAFGVDAYLTQTKFVQNHPRLQYLMG